MLDKPASVGDLLEKIRVTNLVPSVLKMKDGEDVLQKIASRVIEDQESDKKSMETWEKFLEAGRKLQIQELEPKSEPFDKAANFKSPVMLEASLKFGDRASSTLLKPRDLVKYDVVGKDHDQEKMHRGERVSTHMSFQLNYEQPTWREDHDSLLYMLPSDGAVFKFSYFDVGLGHNTSEVIRWPDFSVNQANTSMETCRSFTIQREYTKSMVLAKQREGIWQEYEDEEIGTETQAEESEESESDEKFFIQQMFYDLDEDGYEEPYLVTVHEKTSKVMRIVARFEEDNIMVKSPNGTVLPLDEVLQGADNLGMNVSGDAAKDMKNSRLSQVSLVRINPINCITEYSFIPGALIPFEKEGSFLGIGYVHLLAGLTQAINSTSNTILNAGKLASTPGGFLAKGFRKATGALKYSVGHFIPTLMSPGELQNAVKEFDFKDASQSFYLFNEKMNAEVQRLSASADLTDAIGANAPATTMMGMVQEQLMPVSAITMRIYRSMKKEFIKLAELNRKYTDPAVYKDLVGEDEEEGQEQPEVTEGQEVAQPEKKEYSYIEDYGMKGLDVMPAANPEMTSQVQSLMQSSSVMALSQQILSTGGNPIPVMKRHLQDLGVDYVDKIYPNDEQNPDPQLEAMREAQKTEQDLAQAQTELYGEQVKNEKKKTAIAAAKAKAEIKKIISETILNVEKAETEEVKNQISKYSAQMESLLALIDAEQGGEESQ